MIRFTVGRGNRATRFVRAPLHTADWDRQKQGLRHFLGFNR